MPGSLAKQPSEDPQTAFYQLLEHLRSVLIVNLSYELQTPLSTIQIALETLVGLEEEFAAVQGQMLSTALADLRRLCHAIQSFLTSANTLWSTTEHYLIGQRSDEMPDGLSAVLAPLFNRDDLNYWLAIIRGSEQLPLKLLEQTRNGLMAVINHEIRTSLASMQVCLESLQVEFSLSEAARQELLAVALSDVERLRRLSQNLRFLSRLQSGQVCFRIEPVDLQALLNVTLSGFQQQHSTETLPALEISPASELPVVWADGDRLMEVITRLLENACRFTPVAGAVKIHTRMVHSQVGSLQDRNLRRDSKLVVCVSDTGQGIAPEKLASIFDGFYQAEDYLCRTQSGLGIGLTICRYLVEGMGGTIWAESTGLQQGSQFFCAVPVVSEQAVLID